MTNMVAIAREDGRISYATNHWPEQQREGRTRLAEASIWFQVQRLENSQRISCRKDILDTVNHVYIHQLADWSILYIKLARLNARYSLFDIASEDPILLDGNKPAIEIDLMDYELWPNKRKFIQHKEKKIELRELWKSPAWILVNALTILLKPSWAMA